MSISKNPPVGTNPASNSRQYRVSNLSDTKVQCKIVGRARANSKNVRVSCYSASERYEPGAQVDNLWCHASVLYSLDEPFSRQVNGMCPGEIAAIDNRRPPLYAFAPKLLDVSENKTAKSKIDSLGLHRCEALLASRSKWASFNHKNFKKNDSEYNSRVRVG